MSEFQEVMKQWTRARKAMGYGDDPLIKLPTCLLNEDDFSKLEQEVMTWAAEHPAPVYPTWWDWLESMGVLHKRDGAYSYVGIHDEIPAEFAKAHGIEPKEDA